MNGMEGMRKEIHRKQIKEAVVEEVVRATLTFTLSKMGNTFNDLS